MQRCGTLEELAGHFEGRLCMLRECLQLHNIHQDKKAAPVLKNVQSILSELSADLSKMRLQIKIQKQELDQVQKLKESVLEITETTRFAQNNLPPNLPKVKIKNPVIESVQPKQRVHAPVSLSPACPSIQELKNASASLFLPSIEYLNIQEFQAIPRYMKGRLKYDQVNDLIAQMNAAMEAKYRLLHSAKSKKISEAKFKRVQVMKSQENKATKDLHFVTDADLTEFGNVKLDGVFRGTTTILRHFSRIREIRGQGIVRYAVV